MLFPVDAQLPRAICSLLAGADHEAVHVKDILPTDAPDAELWRWAVANNAVIVTKDEDFVRRLQSGAEGPAVVWLRIGNLSNRALRSSLAPIWPEACKKLAAGEAIVEIA